MENDGQLLVTDNNYDLIRGNPENCIILENCFAKGANGWNSIISPPSQGLPPPPITPFFGKNLQTLIETNHFLTLFFFFSLATILVYFLFLDCDFD